VDGLTYHIEAEGDYFHSISRFPAQLAGSSAKSISLWGWVTSDCDGGCPLASFGSSWNSSGASCEGGAFGVQSYHSNPYMVGCQLDLQGSLPWATESWRHVVTTFDGATARVYIDGELDVESDLPLSTGQEYPYFVLGADTWWHNQVNYSQNARVDEVKVYDYALALEQVQALHGIDHDGDGYAGAEDCEEGDSSIGPGSEELCNGLDDDCDGSVDEDCTFSWQSQGSESVDVVIGCCGHSESHTDTCDGSILGARIHIVAGEGSSIERKLVSNVEEFSSGSFQEGLTGAQGYAVSISGASATITGGNGCGCDRFESRTATVYECVGE
jgi:hypothetical protein